MTMRKATFAEFFEAPFGIPVEPGDILYVDLPPEEPTCEHKNKVPGMSGSIFLPYDICSDCGEVVRHDNHS